MYIDYILQHPWFWPVITFFLLWEAAWKIIAMWKAGRNNHLAWFILIAVINTMGVLPIVYILMHRNQPTAPPRADL